MSSVQEAKEKLVGSATAVTILLLVAISGAMALGSAVFIGFDILASYMSWGKEMATQVNLPYQNILSVALTLMPTMVQLSFVAAHIAGLPFVKIRAFRTLYIGSAIIDTVLDTIQLHNGTPQSFAFSVFISCFVFLVLSEFLFIFSVSVFVSLILRLKNESGLWDMALEEAIGDKHAGGRRGGG
jgi:hypothetical protein